MISLIIIKNIGWASAQFNFTFFLFLCFCFCIFRDYKYDFIQWLIMYLTTSKICRTIFATKAIQRGENVYFWTVKSGRRHRSSALLRAKCIFSFCQLWMNSMFSAQHSSSRLEMTVYSCFHQRVSFWVVQCSHHNSNDANDSICQCVGQASLSIWICCIANWIKIYLSSHPKHIEPEHGKCSGSFLLLFHSIFFYFFIIY